MSVLPAVRFVKSGDPHGQSALAVDLRILMPRLAQ